MKAKILSKNTIQIIPEGSAEEVVLEGFSLNAILRQSKGWNCGGYAPSRLTHINITSYPNPDEEKEVISIVGWYAVYIADKVIAIFPTKSVADNYSSVHRGAYCLPIGAKVDFTPEQIQNELSKRAAEIEMTHCFKNPKGMNL
jgi:hypothetical protein